MDVHDRSGNPEDLAYGVFSRTGAERPLVMKFGGSLVEQLGAQLYPSVTATVAELISNAWDADASNVWVQVPFDEDWSSESAEIVVLDDGHGMTRMAAQATYLVVGRKRRLTVNGDRSEGGRPVHGRKGIGKLAAFGTASYLECTTLRGGEITAFGLDYDELRRLNPDRDYFVDPIANPEPLRDPAGHPLASGTRVRLTGLRVKRKISESSFVSSMSRRFALKDMTIWINGTRLQRFSIPLEYRLPVDFNPEKLEIDDEGWAHETLPSGEDVSWWIGFTAKPLTESDQQGVSVLARDKLAQRPFKFERSQGTTAQLGLEYLVGEVRADWIDSGDDIDTDFIQSNRDQLQLEDARLDEFLRWGQRRLGWALRARQQLRSRRMEEAIENDARVGAVLDTVEPQDRRSLTAVARTLAKLPEINGAQLADVMRAVVSSREDSRLRDISRDIALTSPQEDAEFWDLIDRATRIDAERLLSILHARISALTNIRSTARTAGSFTFLAERIRRDPWILNPTWSSFQSDAGTVATELPDGAFALRSGIEHEDEIAVVWPLPERPGTPADTRQLLGTLRTLTENSAHIIVRGLLIASSFTDQPHEERLRIPGGALRTITWMNVLAESQRMHETWQNFASARSARNGAGR